MKRGEGHPARKGLFISSTLSPVRGVKEHAKLRRLFLVNASPLKEKRSGAQITTNTLMNGG